MNELLKQISDFGIVPVVKLDRAQDALPLAQALYSGGLAVAEITFRTAAAEESIRKISAHMPRMLTGAGTVLSVEQADRAAAAGAKFIVTPGFNKKVVEHCLGRSIPIIPGCSSPSDMEAALELGLDVVKFFPAEALGGTEYLKAVAGPYPNLKFLPTGGVNEQNFNEYLALKNVVACGGSWMVKPELAASGDFAAIEALTRQAVKAMLGLELLHIGINADSEAKADEIAGFFRDSFDMSYRMGRNSIFAGEIIEVLKKPGAGERGHIGIGTRYLERAIAYCRLKGVALDENSKKYDDKGRLVAVFLAEEPGGFAVHLTQR